MILVSQGHEQSIGLEVFFKSFILLSKEEQKLFKLVADKNSILRTLNSLKFNYEISNSSVTFGNSIVCFEQFDDNQQVPQSTNSLNRCLEIINHARDILLTLPTSKDQLIDEGNLRAGYTEFLRARYNVADTAMVFSSENDHYLLVTDHIPLAEVTKTITEDLIIRKVTNTIEGYNKYFSHFDEILFAGINPHVGENGILGSEDCVVSNAIEQLKVQYPNVSFKGPFSGDTLHFHNNQSTQLKVYMYHDQGLPIFKALNGTVGLNISLGLPFLRMSVDHGTAFELYQKDSADYQGALYLLKRAVASHQRIQG